MHEQHSRPPLDSVLHSIGEDSSDFLERLVAAAREHLDADVAFLAQFDGDTKVIRHVVGDAGSAGLHPGMRLQLSETYCYRLMRGELPNIVPDARHDARVRTLELTGLLDIGAYIGVPVYLPDGRLFGTLCCINRNPDMSMHERDVKFMRVLADLIGSQLGRDREAAEERRRKTERIRALMQREQMRVVFQPIVDLATGTPVGVEALARFDAEPAQAPDLWFAEGWEAGLGVELELRAVELALDALSQLPAELYLSFNVSPQTLQSEALFELLTDVAVDRLVVEVTEHAIVDQYEPFMQAVDRLRAHGLRIAVDDVGAGYSGLAHVLRIAPRLAKLDMLLNRNIGNDAAKQALVAAAVGFASRTRIDIVAEGVETADEANTLRILGVRYGQGFHFAQPGPLPPRMSDVRH